LSNNFQSYWINFKYNPDKSDIPDTGQST